MQYTNLIKFSLGFRKVGMHQNLISLIIDVYSTMYMSRGLYAIRCLVSSIQKYEYVILVINVTLIEGFALTLDI